MPQYIFEGDEPARIGSLVKAGIGVAFVPESSWGVDEPGMYLGLTDGRFVREIALLRRKDHYISKAAEEFQKVVLDFFASYAAQIHKN